MAFNPLDETGIPLEKQIRSWDEVNVQPYSKEDVHPYTRTRVILMNGTEVESALFGHQMARHTEDTELKRRLALTRRIEQQQQKMINWLIPANESVLEVTIGYEQVAVDLTAFLARTEPDDYVKAALDFALLEDFDHLYRYANLLDLVEGKQAGSITGEYTEITVGRPTVVEHRHPQDEIRTPYCGDEAEFLTKLHVATIVAAEQQTMNFYMNVGNRADTQLGRGLYLEIAQIEEQHVTHYESLADPSASWFERLLLHEYNECWLYHSMMEDESDSRIRSIWEKHLAMEIEHLKAACDLFKEQDQRDPQEVLPDEMPSALVFQSNVDYVRDLIAKQTGLNAQGTEFVPGDEVPSDSAYSEYQQAVNKDGTPSDQIIERHIKDKGKDYRQELQGPHPLERFRRA